MEKTNKKKIVLVIVLLLVLIGLIVGGFFGIRQYKAMYHGYEAPMYQSEDEVYEYFAGEHHKEFCYSEDAYSSKLNRIYKIINSRDDELYDAMDTAEPLEGKFVELIDEANDTLISFFMEKYNIDVTEELEKLKVYAVDCSGISISVGGFYCSADETEGCDGLSVYLEKSYLDPEIFKKDDWSEYKFTSLWSVYVHETIHYLGGRTVYDKEDDNNSVEYFIEGFTEALTEEVCEYFGLNYEYGSNYIENTALMRQLIAADKEYVTFMISGEDVRHVDEIYEYWDSKSVDGLGRNIDWAINLIMYADYTRNYNDKYYVIAQHFMGEYLKYQELTEEEMLEIAEDFIAPISELKVQ